MPGQIRFKHRVAIDVVIAHVDWTIETEADFAPWYAEYRDYLGALGRKVDLVLELTNFRVSPRVATAFGEYRARVLREFVNRSYRVNQGPREKTYMYTSSAIHGAPSNDFETVELAIAALLADREQSAP